MKLTQPILTLDDFRPEPGITYDIQAMRQIAERSAGKLPVTNQNGDHIGKITNLRWNGDTLEGDIELDEGAEHEG